MLASLGEVRRSAPGDDAIVLSDGRLDRFSFRDGGREEVRAAAVQYLNYTDKAADLIFDAVDRLLPKKYRFGRSDEQEPNKAPEPTPGAVTPRAMESAFEVKPQNMIRSSARGAPATVVAHL